MIEKKVADKIREIANAPTLTIEGRRELTRLANELDPTGDPLRSTIQTRLLLIADNVPNIDLRQTQANLYKLIYELDERKEPNDG